MKTKLVGILNITPDSFSDGGLVGNSDAILQATQKLIDDGADIIDIGAESTRPGAIALTFEEEWQRLEQILPQICVMCRNAGILTSIDTRHALTAAMAIACGIDWINDVSGVSSIAMLELLKKWPGRVVIMHNLGVPSDKSITISGDKNPVEEVKNWLLDRRSFLENHGIAKDRIIIDPGLGFGKTAQQSWELINNITQFKELGAEILVGHSRKSFLGKADSILEKDMQTIEISKQLLSGEVNYLRVHNVELHKILLRDLIHPQ